MSKSYQGRFLTEVDSGGALKDSRMWMELKKVPVGSGLGGVVRTPGKGSWILGQHLAVHLAESVERSGRIRV